MPSETPKGFDPTQGMASLEEGIAMLVSAPEPWRGRLREMAREGALDAALSLPAAKTIGRKLPYWAADDHGMAMSLARLSLSPGDCAFARKACAALPRGRGVWLRVAALLAADAPEALISAGSGGWMGKRDAAAALKHLISYKGDQGQAQRAMEALIDSGAWVPSKGSDWRALEETAAAAGWERLEAWASACGQRAELGEQIKPGARRAGASL